MAKIAVDNKLKDVMRVFDENAVSYSPVPHENIDTMSLDDFDIVIVSEQSDVSKNSKDQTVIETRDINADSVYEKIKYME